MEKQRIKELQYIANDVRVGIIEAVYSGKSGHPGGSLSAADIYTYLYHEKLNIDPKNPKMEDRDRFVLSKGHTSPGLYSAMAHRGFFPVEDLKLFRRTGTYLQGHPDMKGIPGIDMSSGSLGQGLSIASGMALAAKIKNKSYRIYSLIGDGESQEGQIWEAAMFAAHYKLDNLCLFLDLNGLQIDGKITDVMNPTPHDKKFEAFGWNVISVSAHDFEQLDDAAKAAEQCKGKPTVIICSSVKGCGVSYMENQASWHGAAPNQAQYETALADLKKVRDEI